MSAPGVGRFAAVGYIFWGGVFIFPVVLQQVCDVPFRGMRNNPLLGPYSRTMSRAIVWP